MNLAFKDADLAGLSHAVYGDGMRFEHYIPAEGWGICYAVNRGVIRTGAILPNKVVFRGTMPTHFQDWIRDLLAYPMPYPHKNFGPLVMGASAGMDDAVFAISTLIDLSLPTILTGHSLGGQRAMIAAGMLLANYQKDPAMLEVVTFGAPAAGTPELLEFMDGVSIRAYRNAAGVWGDGVPLLPFRLLPMFNFCQPEFTHVTAAPGGIANLDPIAWHSSELYLQALKDSI